MTKDDTQKTCGIIMPISSIDGCNESHWIDVESILKSAIQESGFDGRVVSDANEAGLIHKRIIQNLYDNPIVVCDVSCKNPNVMFELGIRLAFDKPTIIVKDDKTSYSFDTSAIEHLEYPRDLRFSSIVEFKKKLSEKIKATYEKSTKDENYTTFLKHFGEFKVAKINHKSVSGQEYIIDELKNLNRSINRLERDYISRRGRIRDYDDSIIDICLGVNKPEVDSLDLGALKNHPGVRRVKLKEIDPEHFHVIAHIDSSVI
jgi:hypothetical protein